MQSLLDGMRKCGAQSSRGVEYQGPCPVCGGRDRFHLWPDHPKGPQWWCRICDQGGDLIAFYRWRDGLTYREACARAGIDPKRQEQHSAPVLRKRTRGPGFAPVTAGSVVALWAEHAAKFVAWCHEQLVGNAEQMSWLAARGIDLVQVQKFSLGWNSKDTFRQRSSWGLGLKRYPDGGESKLLKLYQGLVIPVERHGALVELRIRRPQGEPRYMVIDGSAKPALPLVTRWDAKAYVVVESALDAILIDGVAGDLVGVVAMGNASIKPNAELHELFGKALHISVSLDSDQVKVNPQNGKPMAAGQQYSGWWLGTYGQAERVPVIGGKDPGDAYKAGVDLRTWVLAGLPPRFRMQSATPCRFERSEKPPLSLEIAQTGRDDSASDEQPDVRILTLTDGREIHITGDEPTWHALQAEGKIVFSRNELNRLQAATATMDADEKALFVGQAVDAKEIFDGAYIRRGEVVA